MPSKKSEQVVNKVKQLLTTASPDIKPNSSQVTKTKSPKTQSLKSIDSKNKTKEEEKEKEKPTVAIDTQTFMIQVEISSFSFVSIISIYRNVFFLRSVMFSSSTPIRKRSP